jgi:hypothetical protein
MMATVKLRQFATVRYDVLIYAMLSTNYIVVLVFWGINLDDNHAVPMFLNVLSFNKVLVKHLRIVSHYLLNF